MGRSVQINLYLTGEDIPEAWREEAGLPVEEIVVNICHGPKYRHSGGWGNIVIYTRGTHPNGSPHSRRKAHRYSLTMDWANALLRDTVLVPRAMLASLV